MNHDLLKQVITGQRTVFLKTSGFIKRDILESKDFSSLCDIQEAIIVTGVRRSGKSYLMRLIWTKIKKDKNVGEDNFLYVNFEDEKMLDFKAEDFSSLLESYFELYKVETEKKIYLFFDEIQNVRGWEKFINRLIEEGKYKIFITGSNATLLSKEMSSSLTGRSFPVSLFPFSFGEFVAWKLSEKPTQKDLYQTETRARIKKLFHEYKEQGGFPEVILQGFRPLLQEYMKNIIYRDIVARYKIRHETSLRELASFAVSNIGNAISLEKIAKITRIKSIMTVKNYFSYLENSYLFFFVPKYSHSIKKQIYNPDKIYVIDTGLYNEVAFSTSGNDGYLLENMAYLEMRRRGEEVYYSSGKNECDFVVREKNKITKAIQVTKRFEHTNREREINGLYEAMMEYNLNQGLILTEDESETIERNGKIIIVKPLWEWLLVNNENK
jgi:hypothetical protein